MNERLGFDWGVSWGAILAGGVVAAAVTLIMLAFGVGAGLSVVSPWNDQGMSASTAGLAAGLFMVATAMIASTFGGYITGRLRHGWDEVHAHERYFRDTAHGFVTWAFATALSATILAAAGTHILAGASAGAIPAAGAGAAQAASTGNPGDVYVDTLLRTEPGQTQAQGQATAGTAQQTDPNATRGELLRIIAPATRKGGEVSATDKAYAVKVVSARTGLPPAEAEQRVNQTIAQAKDAADKARKAAAKLALWLAAAMVAGALTASFAATEGGKLRNSRWYDDEVPVTTTRTNVRK